MEPWGQDLMLEDVAELLAESRFESLVPRRYAVPIPRTPPAAAHATTASCEDCSAMSGVAASQQRQRRLTAMWRKVTTAPTSTATAAVPAGSAAGTAPVVYISQLPSDVLYHILKRLDSADVSALMCTSRELRSAASEPYIWQCMLRVDWPAGSMSNIGDGDVGALQPHRAYAVRPSACLDDRLVYYVSRKRCSA
jgi:hypothetical protein